MKAIDLTGKRFGRLVVVGYIGSRRQGKRKFRFWSCQCDCGKLTEVRTGHLTAGQIQGCGCKRRLVKGESAFNSLYDTYQRNARVRDLVFRLNKDQFKNLTQGFCFYCGVPGSNVIDRLRHNGVYVYNGIDRLDNSVGYTKKNCVTCCKTCNWMKNTMNYKEFIDHVKRICIVTSVA